MKAVDFRDLTWERVRQDLPTRCDEVYLAWQIYGPGTTRKVAEASGLDLLSLRPRTTDLLHLGLVKAVGAEPGEGIYAVTSPDEWGQFREAQVDRQMRLI